MSTPETNPQWSDLAVAQPWSWALILSGRHVATAHLARMLTTLTTNPRLDGRMRQVAVECERLAAAMVASLPDGPELTAGLRKLLEAKDCFVRGLL